MQASHKQGNGSSFDSLPLSNQLSSIQVNQSKGVGVGSSSLNKAVQQSIPAQQLVNLSQGVGTNPQAYDELKKRLLSEYKKLTK